MGVLSNGYLFGFLLLSSSSYWTGNTIFASAFGVTHAVVHHALHHPPPPPVTWKNGLEQLQHGSAVLHSAKAVAHSYMNALHQHPLVTKMLTGGTLATAGDAIAQKTSEEDYDVRRALSFMLFDMSYRALQHVSFPLIVHYCHGQYLSSLWHDTQLSTANFAAMEQTLASQLGIVPFLYYPVFFALTAVIQNLSKEQAWERACDSFLPLMQRNLLFWIPVQFVQFGFVEESLQIPFLSVAGLCWTIILSLYAGSTKNYAGNEEETAAVVPAVLDAAEYPPVDEPELIPDSGTTAPSFASTASASLDVSASQAVP